MRLKNSFDVIENSSEFESSNSARNRGHHGKTDQPSLPSAGKRISRRCSENENLGNFFN